MTMNEFYNTYNLNKYNFAELAGVGTKSLIKFAEGKPIRESTKERIDKAMRVVEKYDLKRPKYDYEKAFCQGFWYKNDFHRSVFEYENRFRTLFKNEL